MMEGKSNIGKWKEALKRRAEMAFVNGDKHDTDVMDLLVESQQKRVGVSINGKAR